MPFVVRPSAVPVELRRPPSATAVRFGAGAVAWPSHTAFHLFRQRLARAVGIELERMQGFGGNQVWSEGEPLAALLAMSDVDGALELAALEPLSLKLAEIVGGWAPDDADRQRGLALVVAIREALRKGEPLRIEPAPRRRSTLPPKRNATSP